MKSFITSGSESNLVRNRIQEGKRKYLFLQILGHFEVNSSLFVTKETDD